MGKKSTGTDDWKKRPDKLGFNASGMAEVYGKDTEENALSSGYPSLSAEALLIIAFVTPSGKMIFLSSLHIVLNV